MKMENIQDHAEVAACRSRIDHALAGLATLHLGPLDYNISITIDALLGAIDCLERVRVPSHD